MTKHKPKYTRIAQIKTVEAFLKYTNEINADLPFDQDFRAPGAFAHSYRLATGKILGNRFCILPMEGWDGTTDGKPTDYTKRRWHHFGISGAKLLWGCEAVAVRHEGRANPNQLLMNAENEDEFKRLLDSVIADHQSRFKTADDLHVGLQLTHSGRFSKPNDRIKAEPCLAYAHPILNRKFGLKRDYPILSDEAINRIIDDYIEAAVRAKRAGFHFVDVKLCHGYLGHELLSAVDRPGMFGGSFENRARFLKSVVEGIKASATGLECAVRLSAFDFMPFRKDTDGQGIPEELGSGETLHLFGANRAGEIDLKETFLLLDLMQSLGIHMVCITAGSPYYNPHIQRPALFPPSDGYEPPEDPLLGVARQIKVTTLIKKAFPEMTVVGSAYSYLQEWLPFVGSLVLQEKMADFIGLGRLVLSYPDFTDDLLKGRPLRRDRICRTFSDCTTAPRSGMISGCYPLDPFYKSIPEATRLKELKKE